MCCVMFPFQAYLGKLAAFNVILCLFLRAYLGGLAALSIFFSALQTNWPLCVLYHIFFSKHILVDWLLWVFFSPRYNKRTGSFVYQVVFFTPNVFQWIGGFGYFHFRVTINELVAFMSCCYLPFFPKVYYLFFYVATNGQATLYVMLWYVFFSGSISVN